MCWHPKPSGVAQSCCHGLWFASLMLHSALLFCHPPNIASCCFPPNLADPQVVLPSPGSSSSSSAEIPTTFFDDKAIQYGPGATHSPSQYCSHGLWVWHPNSSGVVQFHDWYPKPSGVAQSHDSAS